MEDTRYTLKLYSPLTAELETEKDYDTYYDEPHMTYLDGSDLVYFQEAIWEGIEQEALPEEAERGLMTYFYGSEEVNRKVEAVNISVEVVRGRLYGVAECRVMEPLTAAELSELKETIIGQYADGWGEGFEQRPRETAEGNLYIHFWQDRDFSLRTRKELEQTLARNGRNRGDAR